MSFADELRRAEKRMKAQIEQESSKKKGQKGKARTIVRKTAPKGDSKATSVPSGRASSVSTWAREDDIIALYLALSNASKFFKENYSKKRGVSVRAMEKHMEVYRCLIKGRDSKDATTQAQQVLKEFGTLDQKLLQKLVINILRGATGDSLNPQKLGSMPDDPTNIAAPEPSVIKRR